MKDKLRETFDMILGGGEGPPPDTATDAAGGFFCPNFVSDYVVRELSLAEQSVFFRLLRLVQGGADPAPVTVEAVAAACGLTPALALRALESLAGRGLLRLLKAPLRKGYRVRLRLSGAALGLCAVCHAPLDGEETLTLAVARSARGVQTLRLHRRCLAGDPLLPPLEG